MRTIPQRELRNNIGQVLREVEAGESIRVTVAGRPVADLVPIKRRARSWATHAEVEKILREHPLDPGFRELLNDVRRETIDEVWDRIAAMYDAVESAPRSEARQQC